MPSMRTINIDSDVISERFRYIFEQDLLEELKLMKGMHRFESETMIMDIGDVISHIPIVINGSIKVLRQDDEDHELLLYYLESGDTCSVTLNCVSGKTKSKIRAVAETNVDLLFVEVAQMEEWMAKYASWRRFVLDSFQTRIDELLVSIDQLAFSDMTGRLRLFLKDKALVNKNESLKITHHEIANDLNSSRVVISRLMKKLEKDGYIKQGRNEISMLKLFSKVNK
jgi:CRP/FNR family transcriptional regulator